MRKRLIKVLTIRNKYKLNMCCILENVVLVKCDVMDGIILHFYNLSCCHQQQSKNFEKLSSYYRYFHQRCLRKTQVRLIVENLVYVLGLCDMSIQSLKSIGNENSENDLKIFYIMDFSNFVIPIFISNKIPRY